jgi:predicted deacylase
VNPAIGDFSPDYRTARKKFLDAARAAGAARAVGDASGSAGSAGGAGIRIVSFDNPALAPDGRPVHTDVMLAGDAEAPNVLVVNSATHGVEGFCGSAAMIGWLRRGEAARLPGNLRVVLIHAINPHGFAWLRRVTEDNVDLNRNFGAHGGGYPANPEYDVLHDAMVPRKWNRQSLAACKRAFDDYIANHDEYALQAAVTRGQHDHPDGLFFGGTAPSWSNRIFREILDRFVKGAKAVAFLDFHTGLGPYGHGSLLGGSSVRGRMAAWFGDGRGAAGAGKPLSAPLGGVIGGALRTACDGADITSVTVEFGTYPMLDVLEALRADNWLHLRGDPESELGRTIKADIRKRLYPDEDDWKEMVALRAQHVIRRAARGLSELDG